MSTRREFLQVSGALVVCFSLPACSDVAPGAGHSQIGNRLRINANGTVDLLLGKGELGQGIGTALAQMVADELDVSFDRIRLSSVDTSYSPDESYTFSSISIQQSGPPTRRAAAQARAALVSKAAQGLGVPVGELCVSDGDILRNGAATGSAYWSVIGDSVLTIDLADAAPVKPVDEYAVVGQAVRRIDIPGKVFGDQSFLQDLRWPGMVHARVVRPVAERATIDTIDTTCVETMPGVLAIIRDGNFVAVVAEREGQARQSARALADSTGWSLAGDMPDEDRVHDWLKAADGRVEGVASRRAAIAAGQVRTMSAVYQRPYQAHASISPSAAVAKFENGQLTVWSHGQGMYPLRSAIAHVVGLDVENVRCIHREASGCYGHNGADDAACDAAAIAVNFPGRPVRLQWERADEMAWEPYGSAMHIEVSADVDDSGHVVGWDYDVWSCPHSSRPRNAEQAGGVIYARMRDNPLPLPPPQSIPQPNGGGDRNAVPLYTFDRVDVKKHLVTDVPIRVSALRGLGAYANVYAIESFMDELAEIADVDPLTYRLRHLQDERAIALLERLADTSGWHDRRVDGDEGWGLGFARFKNRAAWVGVVMRLSVEMGDIRLRHATAVCDAGLIVNPDGTSAQIEGGIVQSASWTLKEEIRFSKTKKKSLDWASYPILRFDEIPKVEVVLMDRHDQPSLGVGEAAQGPTAAAIANAVYDLTGKRLRRLPLTLPTG